MLTLPLVNSSAAADDGVDPAATAAAAGVATGVATGAATDDTAAEEPAAEETPTDLTPEQDATHEEPGDEPTAAGPEPTGKDRSATDTPAPDPAAAKTTQDSVEPNPPLVQAEPERLALLAAPVTQTGGFEIDGDTAVNNDGDDWDTTGSVSDDGFGDASNFTEGSAEMEHPTTWVNGVGTAPGKTDIGNVYTHNTTYGGDIWSFFGFTRDATTGTTAFDVEYNQAPNLPGAPAKPNRTVGDLLIQLVQNGNDAFAVQRAFVWTLQSDPSWEAGKPGDTSDACYSVPGYDPAAGWCPTVVPASAFTGEVSEDGSFAEGALNISALFGAGTCIGDFGTLNIRSRSSESATSALKDWVKIGVSIPGTCAEIVIEKTNLDGTASPAGATFRISPDPTPGSSAAFLQVTDGTTPFNADSIADGNADGVITVSPAEPGSYTVTEIDAPDGYLLPAPDLRTQGPLSVADNGTLTFTFEDPKVWQPLTATKTATATYDAKYSWTIAKSVVDDDQSVPDGTPAAFDYTVTVTEGAQVTSGYQVVGEVDVENLNADAMVATLSDVLSDGAVCTFPGVDDENGQTAALEVLVPAGGGVFGYECDYAGAPSSLSGTNTATLSWDKATYPQTQADVDAENPGDGTATATASYTFTVDTETDKTVRVVDDKTDPTKPVELGELTWTAEGNETEFDYQLPLDGVAGECRDYTNTAEVIGDEDVVIDDAEQVVTVCVGVDLEVSKNVVHSFDRSYLWDIEKGLLQGEPTQDVDPETGKATFDYAVTVTAGEFEDANWAMSGEITVDNPNKWQDVTLSDISDVVDVGGGAECTVAEGADLVIPRDDARTFGYTCEFDSQPDYEGLNTATVTWDAAAYATPSGADSGTADVLVDKWSQTPINKTITVMDDKTDPANPVELGPVTWSAEGAETVFTYSVSLEGSPGECVDYTNTAWIVETQDEATQTVTVCAPLDLVVSKTVEASYDRTYNWLISKVAADTEVEIAENGEATFSYTVTATPDDFSDSGFEMSGQIKVENPNQFEDITATVTDVPDVGGGAECVVAGGEDVVVPADDFVLLDYTCSFDGQPAYDGTNVATVTWADGEVSTDATVDFGLDAETNKTVDVDDDKVSLDDPELLGTASWDDPPTEFKYSLTQTGVAGVCTDHTNTARIEQTEQTATETVTVCVEDALDVTKTAEASFDRTYHWSVDKDVDQTAVEVTESGEASFDYTVTATPDGFTDSGWQLSGQITVENPNSYDDGAITATVSDLVDVGGAAECLVEGGEDVLIAAGDFAVLDYECTFDSQPAYDGVNTATATWQGPTGERSSSGEADVTFDLDTETDKTVTVTDDKVSLEEPEVLGTAVWNAEGTPTEFDYTLAHQGVVGECTSFTNTAEIVETEQTATQTVEVCRQDDLVIAKTAAASYDRTYLWDITKVADQTTVTSEEDTATISYTVDATPGAFVDSGWEMTGSVTVANPNAYKDVTVALTDLPNMGEGVTCTIDDGQEMVVAAGETATFTYTCGFEEQPDYEGTNSAAVTWGPSQEGGVGGQVTTEPVPVVFEADQETNKTVTVTDDMTDPTELGQAVWNADGQPTSFSYAVDVEVPDSSACDTVVNTATIVETGQDAQAEVDVCGVDILPVDKERPRPQPQPQPQPEPKARPAATVLPATGAPERGALWGSLGGLSLVLGAWLMLKGRRKAHLPQR